MSISDQAPERASYPIGFRPQRGTSGARQSDRPDMTLQRAPWPTRIVYALALAASVLPFGASGWVSLAVGAGSWAGLSLIIVLALAVYRGVMVLTHPGALEAPSSAGMGRWCRRLGLWLSGIGLLTFSLTFLVRPIAHALVPRGSDNGIEFFVVGPALAVFSGLTPVGLLLFEFSRLRAFEQWWRKERACK